MPEFTGEVTRLSLLVSLGAVASGIAAFCLGLTVAARRLPPVKVWLTSGSVVAALVLLGFVRLYRDPLVIREIDPPLAVFFLVATLGLPSAAAVWLAVRRAARPVRSALVVDALLAGATFVAAMPIAMIVASVPDALSLFG